MTNYGANSITMIDGATHHTTSLAVGSGPGAATVNPVTNRYYELNSNDNTATVVAGGSPSPLQFVATAPLPVSSTRAPAMARFRRHVQSFILSHSAAATFRRPLLPTR